MLAGAEQLLGHAHLEQIVERETIIAAAQIQRAHEIALDPVTNTLRRDRENSRSRARGKSLAPAARLCRHLHHQRRRVRAVEPMLSTSGGAVAQHLWSDRAS